MRKLGVSAIVAALLAGCGGAAQTGGSVSGGSNAAASGSGSGAGYKRGLSSSVGAPGVGAAFYGNSSSWSWFGTSRGSVYGTEPAPTSPGGRGAGAPRPR